MLWTGILNLISLRFVFAAIPVPVNESTRWLQAFVLNSIFRHNFTDPVRQLVFNYLRRIEAAHSEHRLGRNAALAFIGEDDRSVSSYMDALFHWESFITQCGIALDLLFKMQGETKNPPSRDTEKLEEKLTELYVRSKHVAGMTTNRKPGTVIPPGGTIPIWMEDNGLNSGELVLTWVETVEILDNLSDIATALVDPVTAHQKLSTLAS